MWMKESKDHHDNCITDSMHSFRQECSIGYMHFVAILNYSYICIKSNSDFNYSVNI